MPQPPVHRTALTRRELLQVGFSTVLGATAATGATVTPSDGRRAKSVILVFLEGGCSQLESFDPKPDAPAEVRGEFGAIKTATPGLLACDLLPRLAARSQHYAVVRTLAHTDHNHTAATHHAITGTLQPNRRFDKPLSREDAPCFGAAVGRVRPPAAGVPAGVTLPTSIGGGPLVWPGQHAGFLGPRYDPWHITTDPNAKDFRVDNVSPAAGLSVAGLSDRLALLADLNRQQRSLADSAEGRRLTDEQAKAFDVLTSGAVSRAFELSREPAATRDAFGRNAWGQSLLLARRLTEAGVPVVQVNMNRGGNWDTHADHFRQLKARLLPPLDGSVSALLDDLAASGRLAETLVVVTTEFGRAPKVTRQDPGSVPGRDHWSECYSVLFAGAGVRGGQVIGRSDARAAHPVTPPFSPDDIGATVYDALAIDPETEVRDRLDRPVPLNRGRVMQSLYTGA